MKSPAELKPRHDVDRGCSGLESRFCKTFYSSWRVCNSFPSRCWKLLRLTAYRRTSLLEIVYPPLTHTTFFLPVINVIYTFFETFGVVDATTQGGPGKDTAILVCKVYFDGFKTMDIGGSAEQLVVLRVIVIALTVLKFRFIGKKMYV